MSLFKDCLTKEMETFFNLNEFAEEVQIDDQKVTIVMDSDLLKKMQLKNGGEGLANSELLFYVNKSDLEFEPYVGQDIMFNNNLYYINVVQDDEYIYIIAIGVAKS